MKAEKYLKKEIKRQYNRTSKNKTNFVKNLVILVILVGVFFVYQFLDSRPTAVQSPLSVNEIKCVDGDTFWVDDVKIRMLAIDTPESTTTQEPYGLEASERTCDLLKHATKIDLYYDEGNEEDKYERKLYWVYVDGVLLQEVLVEEGLAEIKYVDEDTVDHSRLKQLEKKEQEAKNSKRGIWK